MIKRIVEFIIILLLISFVVTCSMLVFFNGFSFTKEEIKESATYTFLNIIFISFIFTIIDQLRRKYTVTKPVQNITNGLKKITDGDFNTQISSKSSIIGKSEFETIIEYVNLMTKELSSVETLRNDFIANVSHELKTPLSVIQNYSVLLQGENITKEEKKLYAKEIENVTQNLATLITNILRLNKLENQTIISKKEEFNLNEQIREYILQYEDIIERKNLHLDLELDYEIIINSDKELLGIIWNNLISNAVKFTNIDGYISISVHKSFDNVIVIISDTGIGMDTHVGKHIFDKFYQGNTSHCDKGNGLGLSLVKRVIDILNSEISVNSMIGKGSTFTIKLTNVMK